MNLCVDDQHGVSSVSGVMRRMLSDIAVAFDGRKTILVSEQENDRIA